MEVKQMSDTPVLSEREKAEVVRFEMDVPEPEWRVIAQNPKLEISSDGEVREIATGKMRTITTSGGRYKRVWVCTDRSGSSSLHRLLAIAFIPNPENLPMVRHLDDDRYNNALDNLAWGTSTDNHLDAVRNGHNWAASKTHCKNGHPFEGDNLVLIPVKGSTAVHRKCRECHRAVTRRFDQSNKRPHVANRRALGVEA
jgi:hypothetical protein